MNAQELIAVGYWRSLYEPALPDPAWFIDAYWSPEERQRALQYLRQGRQINFWMGYSWCRFRCGINDAYMGTCDVTDGTYCWPEGLAHYIEKHALRLPEGMMQHILAQPTFPTELAAAVPETNRLDLVWWLTQKGWSPNSSSFLSGTDEQERNYLRSYERGQMEFTDQSEAAQLAREQLAQRLRAKLGQPQ